MKKIFILLLFVCSSSVNLSAFAADDNPYLKSLSGHFVQGGFIKGQTVPLSHITLDGASTNADEMGVFYIGIPRLADENITLSISVLGEDTYNQPLEIKQNTYKTQYIKGVKEKHVTPKSEKDWAQIKKDTQLIHAARNYDEPLPYIHGEFTYPVSGTITGVYGSRRFYNGEERSWHKGYDFARKTGTPIHAPEGGIVRLALKNSYFNGNLIMLDHGYKMMTLYAHLDSMAVKEGQTVQKGDLIGTVGSTGRSTGPHLHWGLYWGKMALNPILLFKAQEKLK